VALAVCLLFDPPSDVRVRDLWSRLESAGVSTLATHTHGRHHPHLSYAVLRSWDQRRVEEALCALPVGGSFPMTVHGTLAFPRGRAALAISVTPDVGVRQIDTVSAVEATGADLHHYYRPGQWVPHISVATRANGSQLPTVVRMVSDTLPLTVRVERAALVDSATGQTWPLPHIL
jgi:2'-5' RNA ligase